jgi:hypothetical protein
MNVAEHEFEAAWGLPEALPAGERLLWQGAPDWRRLARRAFHLRKLAVYFAALLLWRITIVWGDGAAAVSSAIGIGTLGALTALGLLALMAWLVARTTVYTLTDKRIVLRIGIVLSVTFNLPLRQIDAVRASLAPDGSGDLALVLPATQRIAYLHLWPHARPWHFARPEPMLRALPHAQAVAELLSRTLQRTTLESKTADEPALRALRAQPVAPADAQAWPRAA